MRRIFEGPAALIALRWNVVTGGRLFSKSFLGYTTYKMAFAGQKV